MLVVIAVTSFAESFALGEGGWMLLVVCAVKAARDMSWRDALAAGRPPAPTVERIEQPPRASGGGTAGGAGGPRGTDPS